MEGIKFHNGQVMSDEEENDNTSESGTDSPSSSFLNDIKMSSSKRSKRAAQKRVVSVPIKEVEGSRLKGENATPPFDSWAWRKYGQKPIKGSPYPRAYYRCSSSKGCPARKQVERSKFDPTMLLVTYSSEHNHSWPLPSRTHHHHRNNPKPEINILLQQPDTSKPDIGSEESPLLTNPDEFGWFGGIDATPTTILESPIFSETTSPDADMSKFYPMREEDESLFADLGELPECSAVFRHYRGVVQIC